VTAPAAAAPRVLLPILVSYAYERGWDFHAEREYAAAVGVDLAFMADSGAFTAWTSGQPVSLPDYVSWLRRWGPGMFTCAAPLDVIGDPAATRVNIARMREVLGGALNVLGVYHVGSPIEELYHQCATSPYMAIGGAVGLTRRKEAIRKQLRGVHSVARDLGTRLHGFGITVPQLVRTLPWMSVDSAYWKSSQRTGRLHLFDHRTGIWTRAGQVGTREVLEHAELIASFGASAAVCSEAGFGLVAARGVNGSAEREWLRASSALSWMRFGAYWRARSTPIAAPPGGSLTGPALYLALQRPSVLRAVVDLAARDEVLHGLNAAAAAAHTEESALT
jgi:hypothetical protein